MNNEEISRVFALSFKQASHHIPASSFSNSIRFLAISMVILSVMWCINHFMCAEEKEQEGFLVRLGSRLIRLVIGLMVFILLLNVRGT